MSGRGGLFEAFLHPSPGKGTEVVCKTAFPPSKANHVLAVCDVCACRAPAVAGAAATRVGWGGVTFAVHMVLPGCARCQTGATKVTDQICCVRSSDFWRTPPCAVGWKVRRVEEVCD
jgi:hypothetical protein